MSGLWPLFLAAIGFGILDSCQNTLVFGILSSIYPEEQEQICAFAGKREGIAIYSILVFFIYFVFILMSLFSLQVFECMCIRHLLLLHLLPELQNNGGHGNGQHHSSVCVHLWTLHVAIYCLANPPCICILGSIHRTEA